MKRSLTLFCILETVALVTVGIGNWSDSGGLDGRLSQLLAVESLTAVSAAILFFGACGIWRAGKWLTTGYKLNPKYKGYLPLVKKDDNLERR
jgi:hypothetical protein